MNFWHKFWFIWTHFDPYYIILLCKNMLKTSLKIKHLLQFFMNVYEYFIVIRFIPNCITCFVIYGLHIHVNKWTIFIIKLFKTQKHKIKANVTLGLAFINMITHCSEKDITCGNTLINVKWNEIFSFFIFAICDMWFAKHNMHNRYVNPHNASCWCMWSWKGKI